MARRQASRRVSLSPNDIAWIKKEAQIKGITVFQVVKDIFDRQKGNVTFEIQRKMELCFRLNEKEEAEYEEIVTEAYRQGYTVGQFIGKTIELEKEGW